MPEFKVDEGESTIEFEVVCGTCGAGLCASSSTRYTRARGLPQVVVEACEHCLSNAREEGRGEGRAEMEEEMQDIVDEEVEKALQDPNR